MSSSLLLTRRFAPLFWTQFFSAFSDNFLKNALVFLLVYQIGGTLADALTQLAAAVFIAPYFFLSALGGPCARDIKASLRKMEMPCRFLPGADTSVSSPGIAREDA